MPETPEHGFMLSNKTYDVAKKLVQVILPAVGALYFGLGQIWGLPRIEDVVGSISVIATFLGVCLGISHSNYKNGDSRFDGSIVVEETKEGRKLFALELRGDPDEIEKQGSLTFKVNKTA